MSSVAEKCNERVRIACDLAALVKISVNWYDNIMELFVVL